ncbi:MAG: hypothetical protein WD851_21225 [Pirellulales bacterium]
MVVATANSISSIVASLDANSATAEDNDAYVLIADTRSNFFGGGSVGDGAGMLEETPGGDGVIGGSGVLFGIAAADDIFAQFGNNQDEVALTFSDTILTSARNSTGVLTGASESLNNSLANRIAYTATHEGFHTFGLVHTVGPTNSVPTSPQYLLTNGDVIRRSPEVQARENPFIVTRFDLQHDLVDGDPVDEPNNYDYLENQSESTIGLRNSDGLGAPDLAYVTGTGAFDKITLDRDASNPNLVHVTVAAHNNATFTSLIQQLTYDIDLTTDTEGEILIDSSLSNDLIEIDADIASSVKIRGMLGDDQVKLMGRDVTSALEGLVFEGEAGNDTFTIDYQSGDPLPRAGHDFNFIGGAGTDNTTVIEVGGGQRVGFFVNTFSDAADASVGDGRADSNSTLADDQTTLRAAIQEGDVKLQMQQF